jgi:hypothetical protein
MMRTLLRILFFAILVVVLFRLTMRFLALALPILITLGAIVAVVLLIRRLLQASRPKCVDHDEREAASVPRWRSKIDRIDQRIQALETLLIHRAVRRKG